MDENITQTVYEKLDERTDEIIRLSVACKEYEEKINSGIYTQKHIDEKLKPMLSKLQEHHRNACQNALDEARNAIQQYRDDNARANQLNPSELTDDVKLLQSGIVLKPRDIEGMLERNVGNRTMTQVILRYAEENKIDIGRTYYTGGQEEEETARALDNVIYYYKNWIDKPNAKRMLDRFFGIQ